MIVSLLVIGTFVGLLNFWDEKVRSETIVGGFIMPPGETWTVGGSPYIIDFDLEILPGATLTINPDVVVLFNGYYTIIVNGNLLAIGTKTNRISIGSNMGIPLPGDWNRIQIGPGGHAEIKYCDISYGTYAIYLNSLSNNEITDNNIIFNSAYGIYLGSSTGDHLANNTMTEKGLGIFGDLIEHWNTHNIETSNTVNGKPIHYWKNQISGTIPPGAGQVILGNCTNVNIENQDLTNGSIGIELGFSSNSYITGNNISSNAYHGIYLYNSTGNNIAYNTVSNNNDSGIMFDSSNWNNVTGNIISNNYFGIYLFYSIGNNITGNTMIEDGIAIFGHLVEYWDTHSIAPSNTVNGKSVYYWKNQIGGTIPAGAGQVILTNCTNIRIENQNLSNGSVGIEIGFSSNIYITGNDVSSSNWYAIYIYNSNETDIIGNNASNSHYGIYLFHSSGNNILGNTASSNKNDGIYLCYSDGNNIDGTTAFLNNIDGIHLYQSSENNIRDNSIFFINGQGLGVEYSNDNNIAGNIVLANFEGINNQGMHIFWSNRNNITGNTFSSISAPGIYIQHSNENNITGNTVSDTRDGGIFLSDSHWNNIIDNSVSFCTNRAIRLDHSNWNNIIGNTATNSLWAIRLGLSDWNNVIDNTASNSKHGIYVRSSNWNNIMGNTVSNNSEYGIYLKSDQSQDPCEYNNIVGNTVSNNNYGIYITSLGSGKAANNHIYHNKIIYNTNQSYDDFSGMVMDANQWDNGYPSGGNYWSDYTGPDYFSGPGQDIPGSDAIGDIPYDNISGGNSQDNYPLLPRQPNLYINISEDGKDAILYWDPPSIIGNDHYLLYRSTSQTDFNFNTVWVNTSSDMEPGESVPIPLRTMWNDTNAAFPGNKTNYEEQYYYVIRSVNALGEVSSTSRTVGKWTKTFPKGVSTFSLPLEPIEPLYTDYCTIRMNAEYIKYMDPNTHTWRRHNLGDGAINNSIMNVGEGYEVKFSNQTNYTFTGLPGAMIVYDDDSGFSGFDFATDAKSLVVSVEPNGDVNLTWQEPASMGVGDWYEVYYSNSRDGFFGGRSGYFAIKGIDYFPACAPVNFGNNTATHIYAGANNPGTRLYYMVVPFNASGVRGASTYSIGIWTEEYLSGYDTLGIPLKLSNYQTADWYCDKIPNVVGINYYIYSKQRWGWHSTRMPSGAYDPMLVITEGCQISTSSDTKFIFIGV